MPVQHGIKAYATMAFCRLGVAGLSPVMPGTCGTLLAMLIAPLLFLPLSVPLRAVLLIVLFCLGALASSEAERILGKKDPGEVVIDELVGVWLAMLPFSSPGWQLMLAAFVLFRIFDMVKPWPIRASEKWLPDGWGIMLDDVVAGGITMGCLAVLHWAGMC